MVFEAEINKMVAYTKKAIADNVWELLLMLAIVLAWGGYHAYGWWGRQSGGQAQLAFVDAYDAYQRALSLNTNPQAKPADHKELLEQAEVDLRHAYDQHSRSSYAPFFKALSAHVALQQGNRDAAVALMRESVGLMGRKNPYRGMYEVSLALMLLDGNTTQSDEGLQVLERVANDENNAHQGMALYYLGLWYQARAEHDKARTYWNRIQDNESVAATYEQARSPWRALVNQRVQ